MKLHLTERKTVVLFPTTPCIIIMAWLGSSECQLRTLPSSVSPSGFGSTSVSFYWLFDLCWNSQAEMKELCPCIWDNPLSFSSFLSLWNTWRDIFILWSLGPVKLSFTCKVAHALLPNYDVNMSSPVALQCDWDIFFLHNVKC